MDARVESLPVSRIARLLGAIGARDPDAFAGEVLPQKSTDFYPKLLSGLAIYRLDAS